MKISKEEIEKLCTADPKETGIMSISMNSDLTGNKSVVITFENGRVDEFDYEE